jgi:hypothetical protein
LNKPAEKRRRVSLGKKLFGPDYPISVGLAESAEKTMRLAARMRQSGGENSDWRREEECQQAPLEWVWARGGDKRAKLRRTHTSGEIARGAERS